MKRFLFSISLVILLMPLDAQVQLRYDQNRTLPYDSIIKAYQALDQAWPDAKLIEAGMTDIGKPLHLFVINKKRVFDPVKIGLAKQPVILIINGIHPGEPPGIDASIQLARDIFSGKEGMGSYPDHVVIAIVPVYNVGGCLNRSPYHRANQETPPESGFRGNGKNLDLNRDFMKADTKNARSLERIFQAMHPLVFLDTHVTNGSDHQYVITLIPTVYQKMVPEMGTYFHEKMVPALFSWMKNSPYEMIPYVQSIHRTPDHGIMAYNDLPRVSTGYASMFNTFAFMTENHVYKPFRDQVKSVYTFMQGLIGYTITHLDEMMAIRERADRYRMSQRKYDIRWRPDTTQYRTIPFKGYETTNFTGEVTGMDYIWYDRSKPYTWNIRFYETYIPVKSVSVPDAYIIPQAWQHALRRLKLNGVKMYRLLRDTSLNVTATIITSLDYAKRPYNGHFQHSNIHYRTAQQRIRFYAGDYYVPLNQPSNRYIVEALVPDAPDAFFSWNFFDPVLDQREYFSPSTFEPRALAVLKDDPSLKKNFDQRLETDSAFAANRFAQLRFIYDRSLYKEKSYMRYPVYGIAGNINLPLVEIK